MGAWTSWLCLNFFPHDWDVVHTQWSIMLKTCPHVRVESRALAVLCKALHERTVLPPPSHSSLHSIYTGLFALREHVSLSPPVSLRCDPRQFSPRWLHGGPLCIFQCLLTWHFVGDTFLDHPLHMAAGPGPLWSPSWPSPRPDLLRSCVFSLSLPCSIRGYASSHCHCVSGV